MSPVILVAILAAVVGPLLAYLQVSRKLSGKIGTSEAASLWAESTGLRSEYRERLITSDARVAALETRVTAMEATNAELTRENLRVIAESAMNAALLVEANTKLATAEATIVELRVRVVNYERGS